MLSPPKTLFLHIDIVFSTHFQLQTPLLGAPLPYFQVYPSVGCKINLVGQVQKTFLMKTRIG